MINNMSPHRHRYSKPKIWSIEPKAPSLVSLSIRDQNIPRPPKRTTSLKAAAVGLKKGFSSHNLLNASAQDSLLTLRNGKHLSCSSLRIRKTRANVTTTNLREPDYDKKVDALEHLSYDVDSSDSTLMEVLEPKPKLLAQGLRVPAEVSRSTIVEQHQKITFTSSSETVVRSEAYEGSRASSRVSLNAPQTASQLRGNSARRIFSRVIGTMQKRKIALEQDPPESSRRVREWIDTATPGGLAFDGVNAATFTSPRYHESNEIDPMSLTRASTQHQSEQYINEGLRIEPASATRIGFKPSTQNRTDSWGSSIVTESCDLHHLQYPLRVRVATKAELREVTMASKDSLWTVTQIHAEMPGGPKFSNLQIDGIAVAIVLDNSRLATRKDVKKACFEIMALAASLEDAVDHIGVYCTSGYGLADTCLLSVASPLNLSLLQSKLDEVPHRPRESFRVHEAFLQAAQALRILRVQNRHTTPRVKEDIVVITPSALGLTSCFQQNLDGFRVHLVNSSLIPYSNQIREQLIAMKSAQIEHLRREDPNQEFKSSAASIMNGWMLDSSRCISDDCERLKSHSLADAILHSKSQADAGTISNISIAIHEREDAIIEEVIGDLAYTTLLPGQIISIPIRVKLKSLASKVSIGSISDFRSPSRLSVADAISELELSLGNHLSELFEIQVAYNHSFFPNNTRLETRESCWLPRNMPPLRLQKYHEDVYEEPFQLMRNDRVQKQLALSMTAFCTPVEALRYLDEFSRSTLSENVESFLDALRRRLKHRLTLCADVSFIDYLLASEYTEQSPRARTREQSCENLLEFVASHEQDEDDAPDTPATIVRRRACNVLAPTETDEGEARRIWQHIRRTSRPGELPKMEEGCDDVSESEVEEHEPHIEEIRSMALKHGRKISTATLRSLAKDIRRRDSSLIQEQDEPEENIC